MIRITSAKLRQQLPPQTTPIVGREHELTAIAALLSDPNCRLLTLVGPGGIGKTRLALEAAARQNADFAHGAAFVSLESVTSPDYLDFTIARAVDCDFYERENNRQQLLDYLADLQLLLVIDNFEHLVEAAEIVSDIIAHAPGLTVLATSRERLRLTSETVYQVGGLGFQAEDILELEAANLFLQSARRLRPDFKLEDDDLPHLTRICQLVDGMPLGILLAATWVQTLSLAEIAVEITHSLDFLETRLRDIPERQRSIRAVIDPLWAHLSPEERQVFQKTAVFWGGFTRQAFEAVTGGSLRLLSALVDKSLLWRGDDGRYRVHELLRQYALEHLQDTPEDEQAARQNHARYYAELLSAVLPGLTVARPQVSLEAIDVEIENIWAAWTTMSEYGMAAEMRLCATSFYHYSLDRFLTKEALEIFQLARKSLEDLHDDPEAELARAVLLVCQGASYCVFGSPEQGRPDVEAALAVFRAHDDKELLVLGLVSLVDTLLNIHGWTETAAGVVWDWTDGVNAAREALAIARDLGDSQSIAICIYYLGWIALTQRDYQEAWILGQEALSIFRQHNNLWMVRATAGVLLGRVAEAEGNFNAARQLRLESMKAAEISSTLDIAHDYAGLGYLAYLEQDYAEAKRCYRRCIQYYSALPGNQGYWWMGGTLVNIAKLWAAQGATTRAVELLAFVLDVFKEKRETRIWAGEELERLKELVSPQIFAEALERGPELDLNALLEAFIADADSLQIQQDSAALAHVDDLTERELEIIQLIAQGMSNRQIAESLIFSVGTVKWYINRLFGKLYVANRTELVARARELELIP